MLNKKIVFNLALLFLLGNTMLISQTTPSDLEMEEILMYFKNYRFGSVYVYEMTDVSEVTKYFKQKEEAANMGGGTANKGCYEELPDDIKRVIDNNYDDGLSSVVRELDRIGIEVPDASKLECAIEYKRASANQKQTFYQAYIITTKPKARGKAPDSYIGMVVTKKGSNRPIDLNIALANRQSKDQVFTINELKNTKLDVNEYGAADFYELIDLKFRQGDVVNKTLEAKDIGTTIKWAGEEHGVSESLVRYDNRYKVTDEVLQTYRKITEGNPSNIGLNTNELTISPDLIRWVSYEPVYLKTVDEETLLVDYEKDSLGNRILDYTASANDYLPTFGVELKYGIEGLQYSSLWSERMTLNALWKSVKFGLILPTSGWSSMSADVYSQTRKLTNTNGIGISGKMDFPFYLIKMSDVFDFNFSYVFGDAEPAGYKNRDLSIAEFNFNDKDLDYMIRANVQLHYTFAIKIDDNYLMRFGLGGTVYNIESWVHDREAQEPGDDDKIIFRKFNNETVGGVSGRIDFMVRDNTTPYGVSAFYFDESIGINGWLQIPVIDNTLALRLDATGYAVVFRNYQRLWENSSVITPMLRFIYNF